MWLLIDRIGGPTDGKMIVNENSIKSIIKYYDSPYTRIDDDYDGIDDRFEIFWNNVSSGKYESVSDVRILSIHQQLDKDLLNRLE